MPATEDAAIRGELPAAELGTPQDSQGFQGLGVGARRESLRDEAVRGSGRLRHLHGPIYGGQEEDVLKDHFVLGKNNACIICMKLFGGSVLKLSTWTDGQRLRKQIELDFFVSI